VLITAQVFFFLYIRELKTTAGLVKYKPKNFSKIFVKTLYFRRKKVYN